MSLCRETEGVPTETNVKVIIPGKMITELERLLGEEGSVMVRVTETQACFSFNNVRLVTALIEGTFPNYDMVIPKKHNKEIVLNTETFVQAIRRARTVTNDKFNAVRLSLSSGVLTIKVATPEVGEHREDIPIEYDGESTEIAFNPDFILDVLRHINQDKTCFVLKDSANPGIIKPFTESGIDTYINVIMPIRL
jgi:DNA polymerase-3 subunit beta